MLKYIQKRLIISAITLLVILTVLFLLLELMPGSPFNDEKLTPDQRVLLYKKYNLDKPLHIRYVAYLKNVILKGDFGNSYAIQKDAPVSDMLKSRLAVSIRLGIQSLILGSVIGLLFGIVAAVKKNSKLDTLTTVFAVIGISVPSYVFALGLSYFLGYKFKLFPFTYDIYRTFESSILPTIALSMFVIATVARFMRTELVEVLGTEYILLAEAKGLKSKKVIIKHSIRNALIPVVTVLGPITVSLMTGSLVTERIFGIPGIGDLLVTAITVNDFNVVISIAFFYSAFYILMMLLIDILYGIIDPRIRVAKEAN
ncbi:Oligopeptide transport system permease protein oppB Stage 0 sporulation protein KB [Proteiniborus sp. DW1]|uniref:ABC transporter permease n=1 Tax=Proteiniborus sp. DW1 TaxID=1889883 RepID=UPI00092DFC78|nr:ABC transporter permease [Proteiniborus sp. DW1]SCG82916.1 Oligopeptide transport system permease protein oppB Stage 0 sporulation protein KB [Proteiniborus sp. DW1]